VAELPPLPEIFGNYTIKGITEVLGPEAVSWFPSAPGWRLVGLALLVLLCWRGWHYWQNWRRNRYRRVAIKALDQLPGGNLLSALSTLLKATALQAYPRAEVARLSGDSWLRWLNEHGNGARFSETSATLLAESVYRGHSKPQDGELLRLREEVRSWISAHQGVGSA
jgi:hypothetical protein